ncbi:ABC transporter substrate-binding protein [Litorihabitans aurantiacus]|uniref:SsuA/THI5-like domain-containing protein n=1 Tax=Litorihabitans aurantiacus TaxID=1930061 RepID=A0AA38CUX0_9MICO|nr:ABC transporter substrate-binding protein [Litorihabitans aurantiacus]GMA33024.1 hypothetical protein GCM10025875_30160 [Litorihabitans aurantiacus]
MKTRPALSALAALALTVVLSSCSVDGGTTSAADDEPGSLTVGTLRAQPHLYTPHFYQQFAPEGTDVEIVLFDTSTDIKNAVVSGSIDVGVTGAASVIAGVSQGEGVTIVASSADGGTRIVADPAIATVEDLRGATVGYPMGATQEILLKRTLEAQGLDPESDVELVNLPFSDMAAALGSGQVDAFISAEVGPSIAIDAGAHELVSAYDTPIQRTNIVLAVATDLVESDPERVQEIVDMHVAATELMADDPQVWADGLVETFSLEPSVVATAIENIWPRWELDADWVAGLQAMNEEMAAFGQTSQEADPEALVDTTFVDASDEG